MIRLGSRSVCLRNHSPQVVRFALLAATWYLGADTTAFDHERRPSVELCHVLHPTAVPVKLRVSISTADVLLSMCWPTWARTLQSSRGTSRQFSGRVRSQREQLAKWPRRSWFPRSASARVFAEYFTLKRVEAEKMLEAAARERQEGIQGQWQQEFPFQRGSGASQRKGGCGM